MPLSLPDTATFAVALTFDLDAQCLWMGMLGSSGPQHMSRGEFGALVGTDRLLDLLRDRGISATWCVPGHSIATFPEVVERIVGDGHEIAAHGCYHESIPTLSADEERRLMDVQLRQHLEVVGRHPRGYRSPAWDYSPATAEILVEHGFDWDSSLMADDFEPYRPRPVDVRFEEASLRGPEYPFVELPVSYTVDDMPDVDYIAGIAPGFGDHRQMEARWREIVEYGLATSPGGLLTITMHPQAIARAHHIMMLERLLDGMAATGRIWHPTLSQACDAWTPRAAVSP